MRNYEKFNIEDGFSGSNRYKLNSNKSRFKGYFIFFGGIFGILFLIILTISKSYELSSLKEENAELDIDLAHYMNQKEDLKRKISELEQKKNQLSAENEEIQAKINSLSSENSKLKADSDSVKFNVSEAKIEISELDEKIESLTSENEKLKEQINEGDSIDYDKEIEDLQSKIDELKDKIAELEGGSGSKGNTNIDTVMKLSKKDIDFIGDTIDQGANYDFKLIYRATRDGYGPMNFHEACDEYKHVLALIQDRNGMIIAGYTTESWDGTGFKADETAVLINVKNQIIARPKDIKKAMYCSQGALLVFGEGDLLLSQNEVSSVYPTVYGGTVNGRYALTEGEQYVELTELEVFTLVPKN